jgi:hypothetical protein
MLPPNQCYFLKEVRDRLHSKLFASVDFGPQANSFLSACGAKDEPSVEEIAVILLTNPQRFWDLCQNEDKYVPFYYCFLCQVLRKSVFWLNSVTSQSIGGPFQALSWHG